MKRRVLLSLIHMSLIHMIVFVMIVAGMIGVVGYLLAPSLHAARPIHDVASAQGVEALDSAMPTVAPTPMPRPTSTQTRAIPPAESPLTSAAAEEATLSTADTNEQDAAAVPAISVNYECPALQSIGQDPHDPASNRILVLLQGIRTRSDGLSGEGREWNPITSRLNHLYSHVIYFSYNPDSPYSYEEHDTYQSLGAHHVPLLHSLLEVCEQKFPGKTFDLMGHSMGGRVAFQFAQTRLTQPVMVPVRHVITLDSPVNGVNIYAPDFIVFADGIFESDALLEMHEDDVGRDNREYMNQGSAAALAGRGVTVRTITSPQDKVVPYKSAFLPNYGKSFNLGYASDVALDPSALLGHSQVLDWKRFSEVADYVYDVLSGGNPPVAQPLTHIAELAEQSAYLTVHPGAPIQPWIEVKNVGTSTWYAGRFGYDAQGEWQGRWGSKSLWHDVAPGATITFRDDTPIAAPSTPGRYEYGFMLVDDAGNEFGPYFYIQVDVVAAAAPSMPDLLSPNEGEHFLDGASITVDWGDAANATQYAVEIFSDSGSKQYSGKIDATIWTVGYLGPGTYHWHAEAYNQSGWSGWSGWRSFMVEARRPPDRPTLVWPEVGSHFNSNDTLSLQWANAPAALEYTAELRFPSGDTHSSGRMQTTRWTVGQLAPGTYAWQVEAYNSSGWSGWTGWREFTVDSSTPARFTPDLDALMVEDEQMTFGWTPTGEEYLFEYQTDSTPQQIGWQSQSSLTLTFSEVGHYTWRVKARRGSVESDWSDYGTFHVRPKAVTQLSTRTLSCHEIELSWHFESDEAEWYRVYRDRQEVGWGWASEVPYVDRGLEAETRYTYYVRTLSGNLGSPMGEEVTVTTPTCSIEGWKGEYFDNVDLAGTPVLTRSDSSIDFLWEDTAPATGLPNDFFSARWTRSLYFPPGSYRFSLHHDDSGRLWVDEALVYSNWCMPCDAYGSVELDLHGTHTLVMEMREDAGWASAQLSWEDLTGTCGTVSEAKIGIDLMPIFIPFGTSEAWIIDPFAYDEIFLTGEYVRVWTPDFIEDWQSDSDDFTTTRYMVRYGHAAVVDNCQDLLYVPSVVVGR